MQLLSLKTALVATELDDAAPAAIVAASRLADGAGASLHAVFVASPSQSGNDVSSIVEAQASLLELFRRTGLRLDRANAHVLRGDPANAIGALADRLQANVIVLGPHRNGQGESRSRALGSTALAIVTNASVPCLIVSQPLALPLERVLVPIDLSDTARGALLVALSWASALRGGARREVTLTALHVHRARGDSNAAPRIDALEEHLDYLRAEAGSWAAVSIRSATTVNADVTQGIVDFASDYRPDLVVMGTRGLGLDPVGRLGSVAAAVSQRLRVPTLLVPPIVWMAHVGRAP